MWWDSPIPDVEQIGFGGRADRIPDVERLGFLCDSSDSVVEGPSEVESHGYSGRRTRIQWQEHHQRWSSTIPEWNHPI